MDAEALFTGTIRFACQCLSATWLYINYPFQGEIVQDAFRRGLGHAIQWYDNLQVRIETELEAATVASDAAARRFQEKIPTSTTAATPTPEVPISEQSTPDDSPPDPPVLLVECARVLQQRCPACFGLQTFGRSGAT